MNKEGLKKRTKEFAHRCVKLAMSLPETDLGRHIRRQLIRCGTSVAANYRATCLAQSKASFISKLSVVLEETDESYFWLEFIIDECLLKKKACRFIVEGSRRTDSYFYFQQKNRKI
jgi:four helix bundle protein